MRENIVAVNIPVSRKGELYFFQVNIPDDVTCITGIVAEARGFGMMGDRKDRILTGTLKLRTEQTADICYCCRLFMGDNPVADVIEGFTYGGGDIAELYPSPYSGSTFRGIQPVRIPGGYVVFGCYEDNIGKQLDRNMAYTVSLHLFTERN